MLHQEDDQRVCPYNPSHLIRPKRMITHLSKCRKNYLSLGYKVCPLDATHHIPPEQFEDHLNTCSKRAVVDSEVFKVSSGAPAAPVLSKERVNEILVQDEENWDNDVVPTYDPLANAASKDVMRTLKNAPPAEKKSFAKSERLRLLALKEKQTAEGPINTVDRSYEPSSVEDPIRWPTQPSKAYLCAQKQAQQLEK